MIGGGVVCGLAAVVTRRPARPAGTQNAESHWLTLALYVTGPTGRRLVMLALQAPSLAKLVKLS